MFHGDADDINESPAELVSTLGEVAERCAREAGATLLDWRTKFRAREKGPSDLVTDADFASQAAIRQRLQQERPEDLFVGEEDEQDANVAEHQDRVCWVVDPLDGTANYVHGFPCYSVSVAAVMGTRLLAGAIYDPLRDELFRAEQGAGARLNGEPIRVTEAGRLADALVAVSLPPKATPDSEDLAHFVEVVQHCQAVRRTGSAALNLAYVACGRLDAHWAHVIHPWDCAAGALLVSEAGGVVTASDASPFDVWKADYLVASTESLHAEIVQRLRLQGS